MRLRNLWQLDRSEFKSSNKYRCRDTNWGGPDAKLFMCQLVAQLSHLKWSKKLIWTTIVGIRKKIQNKIHPFRQNVLVCSALPTCHVWTRGNSMEDGVTCPGLAVWTEDSSDSYPDNLPWWLVWQCSCASLGQTCLESGQKAPRCSCPRQPSQRFLSSGGRFPPLSILLWTPPPSSTSSLWRRIPGTGWWGEPAAPPSPTPIPHPAPTVPHSHQSTYRAVSEFLFFSFTQSYKASTRAWVYILF